MFKKDYIVGLDIGTSSVKLVQFIKKQDGLRLLKADLREILHPDDDALRGEEIASALKDLLKGIDVKKSKIIASINCPMTSVKKITAPYMPRNELREGIKLEARSYFPFPIADALLDFEILGDVVEKGIRKYEVAVVASPKMTVNAYIALLGKAGIKPASLIPCSYALQKLAEQSYSEEGKTQCFLDVGRHYTELLVFRGRNLLFSRKIPISNGDFTKAMTRVLVSDRGKTALTLDEAEKIKREVGIPPEGESKIIDNKISTIQLLSMLRAPLEQLVDEIERSFAYYREETGGGEIDSLVLFGGGASLGGLIKFLSEELGIEVRLGDPLKALEIEKDAIHDRDKISYRLGLAVGAALSEAKGVNLLPVEIKEETKRTFKRATLEALAAAVILIFAFIYIGMGIQLGNYQKRISAARMELSSLGPQYEKLEKQNLLTQILSDEPHWEDVFREWSNIIPGNIYLTELSMKAKLIRIKGIVVSKYAEGFLSDFVFTLEEGIFGKVRLVTTKEIKVKSANEFELECWVDN